MTGRNGTAAVSLICSLENRLMKTLTWTVALSCLLGVALVGTSGCAKKKTDEQSAKTDDQNGDTDPRLAKMPEKQRKALVELPAEELKLALDQKKCPVGGALGSMGVPKKVAAPKGSKYEGKFIFICCGGCKDDAEKNFDKYYAAIHKDDAK